MLVMIAVADGIADPGDAADLKLASAVALSLLVSGPVLGRPRPGFRRPVGVVDHDRLLLGQILDPGTTFRVQAKVFVGRSIGVVDGDRLLIRLVLTRGAMFGVRARVFVGRSIGRRCRGRIRRV